MVSKKKSEWPPPGWKVEVKVSFNGRHYKCYINSKTGEKFYSKLAVLRCIKKGQRSNQKSQSCGTKQHVKTKTANKKMHLLEAKDSLNLPPGWTLEWKVRQSGAAKGTKYKCIIDPSTGSKFYSMPEVYRYLKSRKGCAGSSKQAKGKSITNSENNCNGVKFHSKRAVLRCIKKGKRSNRESQSHGTKQHHKSKTRNKKMHLLEANDSLNLPPGWTLVWKVRQSGARKGTKYKCIIDPSTGSKFYSMPEVYRYLNSRKGSAGSSKHTKGESITNSVNNISVNPMSPRQPNLKKELPDDSERTTAHDKLCSGKMKLTPSGNIEKTGKGSKRKHFIDEKSHEQSMLVPLVAAGSNEAQSKRITRSSSKIQSASSGLEQIRLLPESTKTVYEMVSAQSSGEVSAVGAEIKRITRSYSKVQSAATCEPSIDQKTNGQVSSVGALGKRRTRSFAKAQLSSTCEPSIDQKSNGQVSSVGALGKRRTRSFAKAQSSSTCEPNIEQILLLPEPDKTSREGVPVKPNGEVSAVEAKSKRSTRSSSKVESSPTCDEKIPLLPESGKTAQERVRAKPNEVFHIGGQSKRRTRSTKVHAPSTTEHSPLLPEPAQGSGETVPAKFDREVPSVGAQSKRITRSTSKVQSAYICGPSLDPIPLLPKPDQGAQEMVPAKIDREFSFVGAQSKRRTSSSFQFQPASSCGPGLEQKPDQGSQEMVSAKIDREFSSVGAQSKRITRSATKVRPPFTYEPNLEPQMSLLPEPAKETQEIMPAELNGAVFGVEAIDEMRPKIHVPKGTEPCTSRKGKSDVKVQGSSVRKTRVNKSTNKDRKAPNLSSRSSKKMTEAEAEAEVLHSIPTEHAHLSTENCGKTNAISRLDLLPNEPQQRAKALDDGQQNVLTSQQEMSWAFDVNTPTMLHTQVDSLEKIDYIPQEYIEEILLQEDEGPPGFSHYPRAKITQSTIDQLFEDPFDTMPEDMIEKSPEKHIVPDEQQDTQFRMKIDNSSGNSVVKEPTTLGRNDVQPGSQFCFPSPLWSDPCLEFAFKTLTGALPLDDNVATHDFMEHQLRPCDQVNNNKRTPDIGMSSLCQNDEIKLPPPLTDDVGFTKPNGFNSHKPNR